MRSPLNLVRLPRQVEYTLFLIKEELKSRKFFNSLSTLGLDNSYYQPNLDELIMQHVELTDQSNETFDFYYAIMEKYSKHLEPNEDSITQQAFQVYLEFMMEKKRRER
ncbi:MAG TPA: hypothetical protein VL443_13770 [Cyclobacteriaceae bacterium]|jgi:hypothetical protein|nr:hypothetical protein [Cyclobacteriaceae bacterium]